MTREIERPRERDVIIQDPLSQVVVPSMHIYITNNRNRLILAKAMSDEFFFFFPFVFSWFCTECSPLCCSCREHLEGLALECLGVPTPSDY